MMTRQDSGFGRPNARRSMRFQLIMASVGFIGGLAVAVPAALWLASPSAPPSTAKAVPPRLLFEASRAADASGGAPAPRNLPTRSERMVEPPRPIDAGAPAAAAPAPHPVEQARAAARVLIRAGDIPGARRLLAVPDLAADGEALFMLAETYDPTVLAAMAAPGLIADAPTARRYYEAARELGMVAAVRRLEHLRQ